MSEITHPQLQALFTEIKEKYTMPVRVEISGAASGTLTHSQSQEMLNKAGELVVSVTDTTDVDYTLSHELLHMHFAAAGFPQLQYHLLSGTPEVDRQHYAVASALASAALHKLVADWQRAHDLLGAAQLAMLTATFDAALTPEADDRLLIYRTVSLLDHMALFPDGGNDAQRAAWQKDFPKAYAIADQLYQTMTVKALDTPFAYRRAVVNLFGRFNALIGSNGYVPLDFAEFVTVPPVLSARQLRLGLNQVFELKHSTYRDKATKQPAYVAVGKGDGQNAFVLAPKDTTPAGFQSLYQEPLQAVIAADQIDYTLR